MAGSSSMSTSARRFERIAKGIVRQDVESQIARHYQQQFFINKSVFDHHLPNMIETMEDASLSNFFLKYELSVHTTELVRYFSPQSSSKRDFVNLKYLSGQYGYHLCYMALRESALSKHQDRSEVADVVRDLEQTAISTNVRPPDDLFQDPFLTLSSSSPPSHGTHKHPSGSDDVLSGQGESSGHIGHFNRVDEGQVVIDVDSYGMDQSSRNFLNLKIGQAIQTHVQPISIAQALRNLRFPLELEPEDKDESNRGRYEMHRQLSDQHIQGCSCEMCVFTRLASKISTLSNHDDEAVDTPTTEGGQDEFNHHHRLHAHFSGTHLEGCTCQSCQIVQEGQRHGDGHYQRLPMPAVSISEESLSHEGEMIINGDYKHRNNNVVDIQFTSLVQRTTVSMVTDITQTPSATDDDDGNDDSSTKNDDGEKIIEDSDHTEQHWNTKFTEDTIFYRSRTEQITLDTTMPDSIPSSIPVHKSFTTSHIGDCNCSSCVYVKQHQPSTLDDDNTRQQSILSSVWWTSSSSSHDKEEPSRSSLSSFEAIQESLGVVSCDGQSSAIMCPNHEDSFSLSTIVNVKEEINRKETAELSVKDEEYHGGRDLDTSFGEFSNERTDDTVLNSYRHDHDPF